MRLSNFLSNGPSSVAVGAVPWHVLRVSTAVRGAVQEVVRDVSEWHFEPGRTDTPRLTRVCLGEPSPSEGRRASNASYGLVAKLSNGPANDHERNHDEQNKGCDLDDNPERVELEARFDLHDMLSLRSDHACSRLRRAEVENLSEWGRVHVARPAARVSQFPWPQQRGDHLGRRTRDRRRTRRR